MSDCENCGAEVQNKNAAGHYRDLCCECIRDASSGPTETAGSINGCECERCQRS